MKTLSLFAHRIGVLATMHQKQQVMAPLLEAALGIQVQVPPLNTDQFGTFTREIKRPGDQLAAARLKAAAALDLVGETLGFASEGSFGPHPAVPYLASNREMVLLLDRTHNLEVVGEVVTTETNYSHKRVASLAAAWEFAQAVGFPDHGLVAMTTPQTQRSQEIIKGITTAAALEAAIATLSQAAPDGRVHLETDMRAHYNPTRMRAIALATEDLIRKLNHACPQCGWPNLAIVARRPGLPCAWCQQPTELIQAVDYRCQKCQFQEEVLFPEGRSMADPAWCAACNP